MRDTDNPSSNPNSEATNAPTQGPVPHTHDEGILSEGKASSPEKSKDDSETAFLRATRRIEWLQFTVNVILAVIGVGALVIYGGQLNEMRRATDASIVAANAAADQARTSASQLELTERPWVTIETTLASGMMQDAHGAVMILKVTYRNTGNTPAAGIVLAPVLYAEQSFDEDFPSKRTEVCQAAMKASGAGEFLFPNTAITDTRIVRIQRNEVDAGLRLYRENFFSAVLVVCAGYRQTFQKTARYYTGIIYSFDHVFPVDRSLPFGAFQMSIKPLGGVVAN